MKGFDWFGSLDPEEIRQRRRVFKLSTGGEIAFEKRPQYNLWKIYFIRGTTPKALADQEWRSFPKALAAAKKYFLNHPQRKISITEEVMPDA